MAEVVPYSIEYRGEVYEMLKQFHKNSLDEYGLELEYKDIEALEETQGDTTFILLDQGEVIGILAGQIVTQPMADKKVYQESIWYVDENSRKYGVKLIRHLEDWCVENGIKQIVMAFMHNSMGVKLFDFYERMGYKPMETHLIKDVG